MRQPAALLFDLDGTLVDSAVTIALALSELSRARGGPLVEIAPVRRLVSRGAAVLVRATLGPLAGETAADVAAFRAMLATVPADPAMIYPGVIAALEELSTAGHPCAVVTNKPEGLARLLLDQLEMTPFFGAVVGGDTLPVCKPDAAPLQHALQKMRGTPTDSAIMIGDSDVDARAAAAAGIAFVLFLEGYEADRVTEQARAGSFGKFADLPALVRRMAGSAGEVVQ